MTVYARSDVMYIAIPVEDGGCGSPHSRPVIDGAPVKIFALACPRCESVLADKTYPNPCWAIHADQIPLTPDEERRSKKLADEGTGTMRQVAEALAMSAGKILHEQEQGQIHAAAKNAELAEAAEAARRSALADLAREEQDARLRAAARVSEATVNSVTRGPHEISPASGGRARRVTAQAVTKAAPAFPVEVHPSRKCAACSSSLTRQAHVTGRWPNLCVGCRKDAKAA